MNDHPFSESVIEQAALAWLESVCWSVRHGAEIAPGELAVKRSDDGQVVLEQWLRDALLQNLLSGELRATDAERFIGRAV